MYKLCPFKTADEAIDFAVEQFIELAASAIVARGRFTVALSGGSTPKAIYGKLAERENVGRVDWKKVFIFFSDERAVGKDDPKSNYKMAIDSGFRSIPCEHLFRMKGEENLEVEAKAYEALILEHVPGGIFDLVMLGMGDDGHTASLFPYTKALHEEEKLVAANVVPQKGESRLTFTYPCIERARTVAVYILGADKEERLEEVLNGKDDFDRLPLQRVIREGGNVFVLFTGL